MLSKANTPQEPVEATRLVSNPIEVSQPAQVE